MRDKLPKLRILHTNDFHGTLDECRAHELAELRVRSDLYFDSGDAIKAGNLGVPLRPEIAWTRLAGLRCTASALGNRETHIFEAGFQAKLAGLAHPALCANLRTKDGLRPFPAHLVLNTPAGTVGVFGVMVAMVTDSMAARAASAYVWDAPLDVAERQVAELRDKVDLLVALTHIGFRQDRALAERCPQIDLILGGHSHTLLNPPERIGTTWICQGGSHGRFAGLYEFEVGVGLAAAELIPLCQ